MGTGVKLSLRMGDKIMPWEREALLEHLRKIGTKGGATAKARYEGTGHYNKLGKKALEKCGRDHYVKAGQKGGKAGGRRPEIARQIQADRRKAAEEEKNLGAKAINPIE